MENDISISLEDIGKEEAIESLRDKINDQISKILRRKLPQTIPPLEIVTSSDGGTLWPQLDLNSDKDYIAAHNNSKYNLEDTIKIFTDFLGYLENLIGSNGDNFHHYAPIDNLIESRFETFMFITDQLISADIAFISRLIYDDSLFELGYADFRPTQLPTRLHHVFLKLVEIISKSITSQERLLNFSSIILSGFSNIPPSLYGNLLRVYHDIIIPRMSILPLHSPIQRSSSQESREPNDSERYGSKISIFKSKHFGSQTTSRFGSLMELFTGEHASNSSVSRLRAQETKQSNLSLNVPNSKGKIVKSSKFLDQSLSRDSVDARESSQEPYLRSLLSSLLFAILEFYFPSNDPSMNQMYFVKVLQKIIEEKYDFSGDLLTMIAHGTDTVRSRAVKLMMEIWPNSAGHIMLISPEILIDENFKPILRRLPKWSHNEGKHMRAYYFITEPVLYAHYFGENTNDNDCSIKANSQISLNANFDYDQPPDILEKYNYRGIECSHCRYTIDGFGLKSFSSGISLHTHCYRSAKFQDNETTGNNGSSESEKIYYTPGNLFSYVKNRPNLVTLTKIHRSPLQRQSKDIKPDIFRHKMCTVNLFGLIACMICKLPIWGICHQAMRCVTCGFVCHHECIQDNYTTEFKCKPKKYQTPLTKIDKVSESFRQIYGSFLDRVNDKKTQLKPIEVTLSLDFFHLQEMILYHGFKCSTFRCEEFSMKFMNREKLRKIIPEFANLLEVLESHYRLNLYSENSSIPKVLTEIVNSNNSILFSERKIHKLALDLQGSISVQKGVLFVPQGSKNDLSRFKNQLSNEMNNNFQEAHQKKYHLKDLYEWAAQSVGIESRWIAKLVIQQLINTGHIEHIDGVGETNLNFQYSDVHINEYDDTNVFIVPQLTSWDGNNFFSSVLKAIKSCLQSDNVAVNEFGLNLITRKFSPKFLIDGFFGDASENEDHHFMIGKALSGLPEISKNNTVLEIIINTVVDYVLNYKSTEKNESPNFDIVFPDEIKRQNLLSVPFVKLGTKLHCECLDGDEDFEEDDIGSSLMSLSDILNQIEQSSKSSTSMARLALIESYIIPWLNQIRLNDKESYDEAIWNCLNNFESELPNQYSRFMIIYQKLVDLSASAGFPVNHYRMIGNLLDEGWKFTHNFITGKESFKSVSKKIPEGIKKTVYYLFGEEEESDANENYTLDRQSNNSQFRRRLRISTTLSRRSHRYNNQESSRKFCCRIDISELKKCIEATRKDYNKKHFIEWIYFLHLCDVQITSEAILFLVEYTTKLDNSDQNESSNYLSYYAELLCLIWYFILGNNRLFTGQKILCLTDSIISKNEDHIEKLIFHISSRKNKNYNEMLEDDAEREKLATFETFMRYLYALKLYANGCDLQSLKNSKLVPTKIMDYELSFHCFSPAGLESISENLDYILKPFLTEKKIMCISRNNQRTFGGATTDNIKYSIIDMRVHAVKYIGVLLDSLIGLWDVTPIMHNLGDNLTNCIWEMLKSEFDDSSEIVLQTLMYKLCFDMGIQEFKMNKSQENRLERLKKSSIHESVRINFDESSWETQFASLDNLFGLFSNLNDRFLTKYFKEIWIFGPFVNYLVSSLFAEEEAVRTKTAAFFRSTDGQTLSNIIRCWEVYFTATADDPAAMCHVINLMIILNNMYPALLVLDWNVLLETLLSMQDNVAEPNINVQTNETAKSTDLSQLLHDFAPTYDQTHHSRNIKVLLIDLFFQMAANGVEMTHNVFIRFKYLTAIALGYPEKSISHNEESGELKLTTDSVFNPSNQVQGVVYLSATRNLVKILDRNSLRISKRKLETQWEIPVNNLDRYLAPMTTSGNVLGDLNKAIKRVLKSTSEAVSNGENLLTSDNSSFKENSTHMFDIFSLIVSSVGSARRFSELDINIAKCWLDAVQTYIFKYEIDETPSLEVVNLAMKIILEALASNDLADEISIMCITICQILLRRSSKITTAFLSEEISSIGRILVQYRNQKSHRLVLRAKSFIKTALHLLSDSGLFVLIFKADIKNFTSMEAPQNIGSNDEIQNSLENTEIFYTLYSVLDYPLPSNVSSIYEFSFSEAPIRDVVHHLNQFEGFTSHDFSTVMGNLTTYIKAVKPPINDGKFIGQISEFLIKLTTREYSWKRNNWDVSNILKFCECLMTMYPKYYKSLFTSVRIFLSFAITKCTFQAASLQSLLRKNAIILMKNQMEDKLDVLPSSIIFDIQKLIRSLGARGTNTLSECLKILRDDFVIFQKSQISVTLEHPIFGTDAQALFNDIEAHFLKIISEKQIDEETHESLSIISELIVLWWSPSGKIYKELNDINKSDTGMLLATLIWLFFASCKHFDCGFAVSVIQNWNKLCLQITRSLNFVNSDSQPKARVDHFISSSRADNLDHTSSSNVNSKSFVALDETISRNHYPKHFKIMNYYPNSGNSETYYSVLFIMKLVSLMCQTLRQNLGSLNTSDFATNLKMGVLSDGAKHIEIDLWNSLWPILRSRLLNHLNDIDDPKDGATSQEFWEQFFDLLDFLLSTRSDIVNWYGHDVYSFIEQYRLRLLSRESLAMAVQNIVLRFEEISDYIDPEILLKKCEEDLKMM